MRSVIDWWRRRRWTRPRVDRIVFYESQAHVPEELPRRQLAVVGTFERPKWAIFECPCGRGHRISVTLDPNRVPSWTLRSSDGKPSLRPSIDSVAPYRCHFWLRNGRVEWVPGDR